MTLLLGTEVSQRSYFCCWFHCSGECWQKVSLRFPQWKRTGWASSVQHTRGGPSCCCPSGTQSAVALPRVPQQPEAHAAGMVRVPPHPCPGDPRQRWEEKQRRPTPHTHASPRCWSPWHQHLRSCVWWRQCWKWGLKVLPTPPSAEHSPCPSCLRSSERSYSHSRRRCAPCRPGTKMPWEGLPLVGKSFLWGSYLPFLLSGWNLQKAHWSCTIMELRK